MQMNNSYKKAPGRTLTLTWLGKNPGFGKTGHHRTICSHMFDSFKVVCQLGSLQLCSFCVSHERLWQKAIWPAWFARSQSPTDQVSASLKVFSIHTSFK